MTGWELAAADPPPPARLPTDDRPWAEHTDPGSNAIALARDMARQIIDGVMAKPPASRPDLAILPQRLDVG